MTNTDLRLDFTARRDILPHMLMNLMADIAVKMALGCKGAGVVPTDPPKCKIGPSKHAEEAILQVTLPCADGDPDMNFVIEMFRLYFQKNYGKIQRKIKGEKANKCPNGDSKGGRMGVKED